MIKFGRNYVLLVMPTPTSTPVVIGPYSNLTMEFNVVRNTFGSSNESEVRVTNLSSATREILRKDWTMQGVSSPMAIGVGHGASTPFIFAGNMRLGQSVREGTEYITTLQGFTLGDIYQNAEFSATFLKGTPNGIVIRALMNSLMFDKQGFPTGITIGGIGVFPGELDKDEPVSGNTCHILTERTGRGFFIDNNQAFAMNMGDALPTSDMPIISSASGLLGTPTRDGSFLRFDMLLEPRLRIGQTVQLISVTELPYQGYFKVVELRHRGIVSPVVCGDAITTVGLFMQNLPFTPVTA
jgi:hypothetical protein